MPIDQPFPELARRVLLLEPIDGTPTFDLVVKYIVEDLLLPVPDALVAYVLHGAMVSLAESAVASSCTSR